MGGGWPKNSHDPQIRKLKNQEKAPASNAEAYYNLIAITW